jgi:hypothetical protein
MTPSEENFSEQYKTILDSINPAKKYMTNL